MNKQRSEQLNNVRNFAIERHGNQQYGSQPYVYHLDAVHEILITAYPNFTIEEELVAYLHDVVEDTDTTIEEIVELYGCKVGDAVAAITKTEDRQHYLDTVSANPIATKVKICDIMANMQQCLNDGDDNRASYYCTKLAQLLSKTVKSSKS